MQTPENSGSRSSSRSSSPSKSPGSPVAPSRGMKALASSFEPGMYDVICARGKHAKNHMGNRWFRSVVEAHMDEYSDAETKLEKSFVVSKLIKRIRQASPEGGFVKNFDGIWYEVGDRNAREKIGQTFRDLLHTQYRSSTKAKANLRQRKRASNSSGENSSRGKSPSEDTNDNDNSSSYDYSPSEDRSLRSRVASLEGFEVPAYQGFPQSVEPIPISDSSYPPDGPPSFPPLPPMPNTATAHRPIAGYHFPPNPYQPNQHTHATVPQFPHHFPSGRTMPPTEQFPMHCFQQMPQIPSSAGAHAQNHPANVFSNLEPLPFREESISTANVFQNPPPQSAGIQIQQPHEHPHPRPQQRQQQQSQPQSQSQHSMSLPATNVNVNMNNTMPETRASIAPQTASYAFDEMYEAYFAARLRPDAAAKNNTDSHSKSDSNNT